MTVLEKMHSQSKSYRLAGIINCFDAGSASEEEVKAMKDLQNDHFVIAGRPISAYATAVLDRLGIEKYDGDDRQTKDLIAGMQRET